MANPYFGVLAEQDIDNLLQHQLKTESADHIIVESIMPKPEMTSAVVTAVRPSCWQNITAYM